MYWLLRLIGIVGCLSVFSACGENRRSVDYALADSLNRQAYEMRYKDLDASEQLASEALSLSGKFPSQRAEALNNLAFCAFIRMDFEQAIDLYEEVYQETSNELECLVADVGMMKICQRTSMNKEFYDYRNSALRRMKRIGADMDVMAEPSVEHRFNYACSEFHITSAVYYYYLQQEEQSMEAIHAVEVEALMNDTSQLLYYDYMRGSGGMYEASSAEEVLLGEFDYLMDCLMVGHGQRYVYFEANAMQAMAEMFKSKEQYQLLLDKRPGMMRMVNRQDLPWDELAVRLSEHAIQLFSRYGDWYQTSGSYRTKASCLNEQGKHEDALECLFEALSYVNLHHEKYYHCPDSADRLKPYVPMATHSVELHWVNQEGIKTVPEWIARFREQLSVTYAALGMKLESDYNRNIYLDLLDYTRQDKELESRYVSLEKESAQLNMLLAFVIACFVGVMLLLWMLKKYWQKKNNIYIGRLNNVLDICQKVTASIPHHAEDVSDIVDAVLHLLDKEMQQWEGLTGMEICLDGEEGQNLEGVCTEFPLYAKEGKRLGVWRVYSLSPLPADDKALLKVIVPSVSWTLENGLTLVSLGGERKRLEKEQYVHEQHLIENKKENLVKKACLFLVTGMTPYIDRVVNEVHKLLANNYLSDESVKKGKYEYIGELIRKINEYNDILAMWIKMRQGSLNLSVEHFELNELFEVVRKGKKTFEQKGLDFSVKPTDAVVRADKALTLFMIHTLAENARKYTPSEGRVEVYASETEDYIEVSVKDNGPGLSPEDVRCILEEKVYDSGKIGLNDAADVDELRKNKGWGFGLMNCRGIIEKYRKTNALFKVCCFSVESALGKGSRFYFRLPKGGRKLLSCLLLVVMTVLGACSERYEAEMVPVDEQVWEDALLDEANYFANEVYHANVEGDYQHAIACADSAFHFLNEHCQKYAGKEVPLLELEGGESVAELEWFSESFDTDYHVLLDVRNEAAVAYLALGKLDAYRYNNQAYASLYKQISVDESLEYYCLQMQKSAGHKVVAIILCFVLLLFLIVGYYMMYFRHLVTYRHNLEQVLEVNRKAFDAPVLLEEEEMEKKVALTLVEHLSGAIHELMEMENMALAVYNEEADKMGYAFSGDAASDMKEEMETCFQTKEVRWDKHEKIKSFPLYIDIGEEKHCMGVLAVKSVLEVEDNDLRLMMELVAGYVAIVVYNAITLVAQKHRDIEFAQDETSRILREKNILHVQNQVLDNCLSTIKHETIYYPNKIKQIVDRLSDDIDADAELRQVETMSELIGYYKEIFTLLSLCAARQVEHATFRRSVVRTKGLVDYAQRYLQRASKRLSCRMDLKVDVEDLALTGDEVLLKFLLENLIRESVSYEKEGVLELRVYREDGFVRFDYMDRRRTLTQGELNQLFNPRISAIRFNGENVLEGVEYLLCKQIIREHDEFAGRRGCRINAEPVADGEGFMVWFTVPVR